MSDGPTAISETDVFLLHVNRTVPEQPSSSSETNKN